MIVLHGLFQAIQTRKEIIETKSQVLAVHPDRISYQTQTLLDMIYQENWSKLTVQMLHLHLQVQYNIYQVSSISELSYSYPVDLMVEERCCLKMGSSTQSSAAEAPSSSGTFQPDTMGPEATMNPMITSNTSPVSLIPGGEENKGMKGKILLM